MPFFIVIAVEKVIHIECCFEYLPWTFTYMQVFALKCENVKQPLLLNQHDSSIAQSPYTVDKLLVSDCCVCLAISASATWFFVCSLQLRQPLVSLPQVNDLRKWIWLILSNYVSNALTKENVLIMAVISSSYQLFNLS